MVDPFQQSTETSALSSLPMEDSNSDSIHDYSMGPVLKAMLEQWDKGEELLTKKKKKKKHKNNNKDEYSND